MTCPDCNGEKHIIGMFPIYADDVPAEHRKPFIKIPCSLCSSTGEVDEGYIERIKFGDEIRKYRLKHDLTLREFCLQSGLDVQTISDAQRGKEISGEAIRKIVSTIAKGVAP